MIAIVRMSNSGDESLGIIVNRIGPCLGDISNGEQSVHAHPRRLIHVFKSDDIDKRADDGCDLLFGRFRRASWPGASLE
ncbi:MAG: hypothetical protein WDO70_09295 [Alphaproteobacteria bacterium]